MWRHEEIAARAYAAEAAALAAGRDPALARRAMIDVAIGMAIDNASFVAEILGAYDAQDEIIALKERCTVTVRRCWLCRLFC